MPWGVGESNMLRYIINFFTPEKYFTTFRVRYGLTTAQANTQI